MTLGPCLGLLLLLQIILYHMAAAAVYNYNETSEEIPYQNDPNILSGFRNITDKDFLLGGLIHFECFNRVLDCYI